VAEEIERYTKVFVGVHVADWGEGTRGWCDRILPGDGVSDLPQILGALDRAGWDGYYDLEIFSDNGTFGNAWPDSLWDVSTEELVRRGKDAFERVWDARIRTPLDQVSPGVV
jgi:sugar phosphate isomerase/epimerase